MIEINTVYPEKRWISEDTIWYDDAVADGDCAPGYIDLDLIMEELMSAGIATFTTKMRYGKWTQLRMISPMYDSINISVTHVYPNQQMSTERYSNRPGVLIK